MSQQSEKTTYSIEFDVLNKCRHKYTGSFFFRLLFIGLHKFCVDYLVQRPCRLRFPNQKECYTTLHYKIFVFASFPVDTSYHWLC